MDDTRRSLLGHALSPIGLGSFKIGRSAGAKYPSPYDVPSDEDAEHLLNGVLDAGITLIDTAPAYGSSEERIGRFIGHRRGEYVLCTKAGEHHGDEGSTFDFSAAGIRRSLDESLARLRCDHVDILLLHSSGEDMSILEESDAPQTLCALRDEGRATLVGFSGKTRQGELAALAWADVLMVDYSITNGDDTSSIEAARDAGAVVLIKKGLASGHVDGATALGFLLGESPVADCIDCVVIGSTSVPRMASNLELAESLRTRTG